MSLFVADYPSGRKPSPESGCAGVVVSQLAAYAFPAAAAVGDIIEIGVLPSAHRIIGLRLVASAAAAGAVAQVGLMSGEPGNTDDTTRALAADDLVKIAGEAAAPGDNEATDFALLLPASDDYRSIALKVGTAVAANAGSVLLQILYSQ